MGKLAFEIFKHFEEEKYFYPKSKPTFSLTKVNALPNPI